MYVLLRIHGSWRLPFLGAVFPVLSPYWSILGARFFIRGSIFIFCSKCQKYSPTESNKAHDKAASRRAGFVFDPQQVVAMVKQIAISARRLVLTREECVKQYLEVSAVGPRKCFW